MLNANAMSDTTFGLLLLFSNLVLWVLNRTSQRLASDQRWSDRLDRYGQWLVIASTVLFLLGLLLDWLDWLPFQVAVNSLNLGFLCLVLATPVVSTAFLWHLHARIGFRQLAKQLCAAIRQRLPERPTQQTLLNLVRFSAQLCVATVVICWGLLRVIAGSGVLDKNKNPDSENDITSEYDYYYDSNKYNFRHLYDEQDF